MVMNHHVEHLRWQHFSCSQGVESMLRVLAHHCHLILIEPTGLLENRQRYAGLTNIVKHSGE